MAHELRVDGRVVAAAEIAWGQTRARGLLGRDGYDGAMFFPNSNFIHTIRMRFALDVAYLDRTSTVVAVKTMVPGRIGRPRLTARSVLECRAGNCARWGVVPGSRIEIDDAAG